MGLLHMSEKERRRLEALGRVMAGDLTLRKAAELSGISYRQMKRSWKRFKEEGDASLVHGHRGRPPNSAGEAKLRQQVLKLYAAEYSDHGPTLAAECMQEEHDLTVSVSTLRRWLIAEKLWTKKPRRGKHRRRRERKEQAGEMVQMDGSEHDWFEGRSPKACLMVMVDDATGRVLARFFESETSEAAFAIFREYVVRYGVPRALYVDRDSIYRPGREPTLEERHAGEEAYTQFGRAMKELGVRIIMAHSPQAKGRVERMNGTLQDRLPTGR